MINEEKKMLTITRIELDAWGTLVAQEVIAVNVADQNAADQIIEDRPDADDPLVRYVAM